MTIERGGAVDERPDRTVTLVVPLPGRTGRPAGAPYIERTDRTADRTLRPVERPAVQPEIERPVPAETVRPASVQEPERTLHWQTVTPTERPVREPVSDGGQTALKIIVIAVPAAGVVGGAIAATGLPSLPSIDIRPVIVVVGTIVLGVGLSKISGVLRAIVEAISGGRR